MSCPDCFSGHQHEGTPKGKMIKLHGLDTYITEPPEGRTVKGIIVIVPDAFGIDFVNNKILADTYAAKGDYRVYLPDFMLGYSCPAWIINTMTAILRPGNYLSKPYHFFWAMYGFVPWMIRNRPGKSFPIVKSFFEALRKEVGSSTPLGVAGFCWGGKHIVLLANPEHMVDGKPMYDAGFTGHPTFLEVPKDIEKIAIPISFAVGEKDTQLSVPRDTDMISKIMEGKEECDRGEVRVYQGCGHGFCVRVDPMAEDGMLATKAAEAEDQAIAWFKSKLRESSS